MIGFLNFSVEPYLFLRNTESTIPPGTEQAADSDAVVYFALQAVRYFSRGLIAKRGFRSAQAVHNFRY